MQTLLLVAICTICCAQIYGLLRGTLDQTCPHVKTKRKVNFSTVGRQSLNQFGRAERRRSFVDFVSLSHIFDICRSFQNYSAMVIATNFDANYMC